MYLLGIALALTLNAVSQVGGINEAKDRKPGLFAQMPDTIPVEISTLNALVNLEAGSEVILPLTEARLPFKGTVMANAEKYNGRIHSVSVRSSTHQGAIFHLSRSEMEDGAVVFRGTWMHKDFAELYQLLRQPTGYLLIKKKFTDLVIE